MSKGLSFVFGALMALVLAAPTAQAQAVCELDWNCDGVVSFADVYENFPGGLAQVKSRGFYADVYYYTVYHFTYPEYVDGGYYHEFFQCGTAGDMDWNGDGVIEIADAYEGTPSAARLNNFYTQWYVWEYYNDSYSYFYPNSNCGAGVLCNYNSECGADEYCAGEGCGSDLTCDPYLPQGICTPKRDVAECAGAPIEPACGCDYEFYLNSCELEAAGVRYQSAGMCSPLSCETNADCPCGLTCIGEMAKQCLPGPVTEECPAVDYVDVGGPAGFGEVKFLTALGGKVYFQGNMPATGAELQVYDPATGLVTNAADINPGVAGSSPWDLIVHLGKLYFKASGADFDSELYVYDPASPGAATKIDVNPTSFSGPRNFLSGSNGKLYFEARTPNEGWELHSYDPASGNVEYWDHWPGLDQYGQPYSTYPKEMVEHNGYIYLSGKGTEGTELYKFSLATEQLTRLSNIATGYDASGNGKNSYPQYLTIFNGELFFNACDDAAVNCELWILDLTNDSLREIVIDDGLGYINGGLTPVGGAPSNFTEWGGKLYFRAQQVPVGIELFVYDPATDDFELAWDSHVGQYDFCWGPGGGAPCMPYGNDGHTDQLTLVGDKIYYVATFENREIWEYDLNTGVGQPFMEIFPGVDQWGNPGHGEPRFMIELDGNLYFQGSSEEVGYGAYQEFFMVTWAPENC